MIKLVVISCLSFALWTNQASASRTLQFNLNILADQKTNPAKSWYPLDKWSFRLVVKPVPANPNSVTSEIINAANYYDMEDQQAKYGGRTREFGTQYEYVEFPGDGHMPDAYKEAAIRYRDSSLEIANNWHYNAQSPTKGEYIRFFAGGQSGIPWSDVNSVMRGTPAAVDWDDVKRAFSNVTDDLLLSFSFETLYNGQVVARVGMMQLYKELERGAQPYSLNAIAASDGCGPMMRW